MSKEQEIEAELKLKCPDCKKKRYLIKHHIITRNLANYLIEIGNYYKSDVNKLRQHLSVTICKDCEFKFHNKHPEVLK